jgi:hypothetical protein
MLFISNFVLDLTNINMKRSTIISLWCDGHHNGSFVAIECPGAVNTLDLVHTGVIFLLVVFAVFLGISRVRNTRRGDHKRMSYPASFCSVLHPYLLYLVVHMVALLIVKDRVVIDTEQLIGSGILGMGLAFAITWAILNSRGLQHDNRIREYRARHNFTQEELARLVNVRREPLSFWRRTNTIRV